jgi:hypothetical protein
VAAPAAKSDTAITDTATDTKEHAMNTTATTKSFALFAIAAVAVVGAAMLSPAKPAAREIVQLERVVIVGKRAEAPVIAQLPRVVITGRSAAAVDTRLAAADMTQRL